MTKELLQKIGHYANKQQLSIDEYTILLERAYGLKHEIDAIYKEKVAITASAAEKINLLNKEMHELQLVCSHEITTFNQGCQGMRSYYSCDLCGKEVQK